MWKRLEKMTKEQYYMLFRQNTQIPLVTLRTTVFDGIDESKRNLCTNVQILDPIHADAAAEAIEEKFDNFYKIEWKPTIM
jgi:hypothetical protein